MGKALYRKYRSKSLSEVVGQEHITDTLAKAVSSGNISHAYLFTGPKGVGKTSVARILAHQVNQIPYEDDAQHIDIIEIDAASNRRIDEIRELREKVYIAPTSATYKVYIIDEVHMLTREAFNALLKTLEEPPAHVIFILATTDMQKLPETIISRTQRFSFRPIPQDKVVEHLRFIASEEGTNIEDSALELLAEHGEGSFRDSISLLDQASSHGEAVTEEAVRTMLGIPPSELIEELYSLLQSGSSQALMSCLNGLYDLGYSPHTITKALFVKSRDRLQMTKQMPAVEREANLKLLESLLAIDGSVQPARLLEIVLLQNQTLPAAAPELKVARAETPVATSESTAPPAVETSPPKQSLSKKNPSPPETALSLAAWPHVLETLKKRHNTLYGVVRMAEPIFQDDHTLQLQFAFAFHQKRISEPANRQILAGIVKEVTGQSVTIECLHNKQAVPPKASSMQAAQAPNNLETISNIFGGGELLES